MYKEAVRLQKGISMRYLELKVALQGTCCDIDDASCMLWETRPGPQWHILMEMCHIVRQYRNPVKYVIL